MSRASRLALLAATVVVAVVLFVVLKPDDDSDSGSSSTQSSSSTATTPKGGKGNSPPPIANVKVKDGKPVGGVRELEFGKGQTVRFAVTSDVADEVHVHGYDLMKDVTPGRAVRFSFEADQDGEFEVELEDHAVQIASLKVTP